MSLNYDIIQFVTDTTARIQQKYPVATRQQRIILDQNTGRIYWDVNQVRYKTPKISYTVNQGSDAVVTGGAVTVYVKGIVQSIQRQIGEITLTVDKQLSPTSTNPVQNKAIKAGIDLALSDAKQYTDSKYRQITSSYVPASSVAQTVQANATSIPTGGAVYSFVSSSISTIQPQSLSELADTNINGPSDGQVLSYNSSTSKWCNKTIQQQPARISWTMYV